MNVLKLKSLYESRAKESHGRWRFLTEMRHGLGLCDLNGNDYKDAAGNRVLKNAKVRPESFSLQEAAEGIVGTSWREVFNPESGNLSKYTIARGMLEQINTGDARSLVESTGFGLDPGAFLNINTYTALVGGLVEVKILEAFQNPQFIADKLMPVEQTKLNGQKVIGVQGIGDRGKKRLPGETHQRAQFGERWIETPETRENALAIDVLKETVFFDLTGAILSQASEVGKELGYRKELEVIDLFLGAVNNFKYGGSAYNTFQTSRTLGYLNDGVNQMIDWTALNASMMLFMRMEDPHTGKRILTNPNTVVVMPQRVATAKLILNATSTERRTAVGATQATASELQIGTSGSNPFAGQFELVSSPLLEQRALAADGLNLNQTNTDGLWYMLESGKPYRYMQNYPLTVTQASPTNYEMIDRGVVASYFANERGIPSVWSPWHIVRNKWA
jgi:hypothetical protein